jgi:hypothetical protein
LWGFLIFIRVVKMLRSSILSTGMDLKGNDLGDGIERCDKSPKKLQ